MSGGSRQKLSLELARLFCCFAVHYRRDAEASPSFPAVVSSLGSGGLRLDLQAPLRRGDRVWLTLQQDQGAQSCESQAISCMVQWCRKLPGKSSWQAGFLVTAPWSDLHT